MITKKVSPISRDFLNDECFFSIKKMPLYAGYGKEYPVKNSTALVDSKHGQVVGIVSNNYKVTTNAEIYQAAGKIWNESFTKTDFNELHVFNIIQPKTRSFCRLDLISDAILNDDGEWFTFMRVSNSYNRMLRMKFEFGFCRGICANGMIFSQNGVEISTTHLSKIDKLLKEARLKRGIIQALEKKYINNFDIMKKITFPKDLILPFMIDFLGIKLKSDVKKNFEELPDGRQYRLYEYAITIDEMATKYTQEMGENIYALFNVMTDYASHPTDMISILHRNSLQKRCAAWANQFIESQPIIGHKAPKIEKSSQEIANFLRGIA